MKRINYLLITLCLLVVSGSVLQAQGPASPRATVEATIDGAKISVDYGRPYVKGRKIFGGLEPYDKVWRTGANKATHLTTDADLMIGNLAVPKGTYTLFTIPSASGWKLIINKKTGQWGIPYKYEADELGRVDMKVMPLKDLVEQFTFTLTTVKGGGLLKLEWENTAAAVTIKVKK